MIEKHETETWQTIKGYDVLTPAESKARHDRMMGVIAARIAILVTRLRGHCAMVRP